MSVENIHLTSTAELIFNTIKTRLQLLFSIMSDKVHLSKIDGLG